MKFGVREICDVVFKATDNVLVGGTNFEKGQPVLYIDTAKTSTLEGAATTVYAQGGKGNTRLLAWEGEKTLTFTVEDALLSPIGFSVLTGAGLLTADEDVAARVHTTAEVLVKTLAAGVVTVEVSLDDLGVTADTTVDTVAKIYGVAVDEAGAVIAHLGLGTATPAVITDGTPMVVTFAADVEGTAGLTAGKSHVLLDFYIEKSAGVTEMQIDAAKFAGYYYVEASTLFRDQATGTDLEASIILPKVKIQSNFTFAMAATGDPSTFSFVMDAFPAPTAFSTNKVLCAIQIVGDSAVG